jgi:hypothetical protein
MPTVTISPPVSPDVSNSAWGFNGSYTTLWQTLTLGGNTNFISYSGATAKGVMTANTASLGVSGTVTAVQFSLICATTSTKGTIQVVGSIQSSGTALTSSVTFNLSGSTFSTYQGNVASIITPNCASWTGLQIVIGTSSGNNGNCQVSKITSVIVTYSASADPVERRFQGVPNAAFHGMPGSLGSSSPSALLLPRRKIILPPWRKAA